MKILCIILIFCFSVLNVNSQEMDTEKEKIMQDADKVSQEIVQDAEEVSQEVVQEVVQDVEEVVQEVVQDADKIAQQFIDEHVKIVAPLYNESAYYYWEATAKGEEELYNKAAESNLKYDEVYLNKEDFEKVKKIHESDIKDPLIRRQIDILYNNYLSKQIDPELNKQIVELETLIESKFNTYRAKLDGKEVSDNVIVEILKTETDIAKRKEVWESSKTIGEMVKDDVIALVKLRNKAAKQLGFNTYYEMSLYFAEQKPEEILAIFEKLYEAAAPSFKAMKAYIDGKLSEKYNIPVDELMPYHYQDRFFQEVQNLEDVDLDKYISKKDVRTIVDNFYKGLGLDLGDMLKNSDLYGRDKKYQHAYCIDMNKEGDVRTMTSLQNNRSWLETLLHECGHGAYSLYINRKLPWLLREEAHIFTTEAIAQLFESVATNPSWIQQTLEVAPEEVAKWEKTLRTERKMRLLIFCMWCEVMLHFERDMYANPDQDLNKLWYDYVEKYQLLQRIPGRNKADWAAKIHLAAVPVYYHNYLLGELMASQLLHYMANNLLNEKDIQKVTFLNQEKVGEYLKTYIFSPGKTMTWSELLINATGETLNPEYFIQDIQFPF